MVRVSLSTQRWICTRPLEDIIMPLSNPIRGKDGKLMHEIHVPKGTLIQVANWTSNINKAIWGDDAEEWKPERWLSPLPDRVKDARIPGVYANLYVDREICARMYADYVKNDILWR